MAASINRGCEKRTQPVLHNVCIQPVCMIYVHRLTQWAGAVPLQLTTSLALQAQSHSPNCKSNHPHAHSACLPTTARLARFLPHHIRR